VRGDVINGRHRETVLLAKLKSIRPSYKAEMRSIAWISRRIYRALSTRVTRDARRRERHDGAQMKWRIKPRVRVNQRVIKRSLSPTRDYYQSLVICARARARLTKCLGLSRSQRRFALEWRDVLKPRSRAVLFINSHNSQRSTEGFVNPRTASERLRKMDERTRVEFSWRKNPPTSRPMSELARLTRSLRHSRAAAVDARKESR